MFRIAIALCCLVGCTEPAWDAEVAHPAVVDLDPDPRVIELNLTAAPATLEVVPGAPTELYAFNGIVPGPHIEANVGDHLIVHFRNELPEPTTVHWHGIRLPNEMDGVPDHTQPPVPTGGTFDYEFDLRDEGLYWFHPHVRSAAQQAAGLYGTILVRAPDEPVVPEVVLVLSDIAVDGEGRLRAPDLGGGLASVFGREGDVILVNGRVRPTVRVHPSETIRLRLVNAAISRYMQLRLGSARFRVIGGDAGIHPFVMDTEMVVLAPGERRDVLVTPSAVLGELPLEWVPYDRGYGSTEFRNAERILDFVVSGGRQNVGPIVVPRRELTRIDLSSARTIDGTLELGMLEGRDAFLFTGVPGWPDAPLPVALGETLVFRFVNTSAWSHPIHLHGFFFQRVVDGRTDGFWRDTIDVPHDGGEATFAVRFDERPGMWMFHCHILDHAEELRMMGMIDLSSGHMH